TAVYLFTRSPHSVLGGETSHFNIYSEETILSDVKEIGPRTIAHNDIFTTELGDEAWEAWDDKRRGSSQDIKAYRITEEATEEVFTA
ncbi:unnamed protein product, partial [Laminaria digitata]